MRGLDKGPSYTEKMPPGRNNDSYGDSPPLACPLAPSLWLGALYILYIKADHFDGWKHSGSLDSGGLCYMKAK